MFTVEMDHDETIVTVLDDVGVRGDVSFFFYEDMVIKTIHQTVKPEFLK